MGTTCEPLIQLLTGDRAGKSVCFLQMFPPVKAPQKTIRSLGLLGGQSSSWTRARDSPAVRGTGQQSLLMGQITVKGAFPLHRNQRWKLLCGGLTCVILVPKKEVALLMELCVCTFPSTLCPCSCVLMGVL